MTLLNIFYISTTLREITRFLCVYARIMLVSRLNAKVAGVKRRDNLVRESPCKIIIFFYEVIPCAVIWA